MMPQRRRTGYSILEVLIAFAVMSTILAVLVPGQIEVMSRASAARQQEMATDYAISVLERIHIVGLPLNGETERTYGGWSVRESVVQLAALSVDDSKSMIVDRVRVNVEIRDALGSPLAEVSRMIVLKSAP